MKVLLINKTFGNFGGGCEKASYETGKILKEKGFEVFFFSSDKKPYYEENYKYSNFFPKDFMENRFYNPIKIFYNLEAEKKLTELIKIIKPDIVHVNGFHHHLTSSIFIACKKNKIPTVVTFHDSHFVCPTATLIKGKNDYCKNMDCMNGNIIPCIKNKCFNNSLLKSSIVGLEYLFRKKLNFSDIPDAFICPSNYLFNIAVKSGIPEDKLFVLNNFVNLKYLDILPTYSNQNYFLYVGRLVKEKGLEHLLKAFRHISKIKLRIVGQGAYRNDLEKIAKDLNLSNVEFLGFKCGDELEKEYKNCIATVLPSVCSEIFGLTTLESFMHGKPVIASNIGGLPEIVKDRFNGLLVSPGNSEEIKQAVLKLYNNKEMTLKMGVNARKILEEKYNSEIYFEKLNNIYNHVFEKYSDFGLKINLSQKISIRDKSFIHQ